MSISLTPYAKDFDRRHEASGYVVIDDEQIVIYGDGAVREKNPQGRLFEVPTDEYERLKIQIKFREAIYERAAAEFHKLRQSLADQARANVNTGWGPPDQKQVDRLKELMKTARQKKKEWDAVVALLEATPKAKKLKASEDAKAENRSKCEQFVAQMSSLKL